MFYRKKVRLYHSMKTAVTLQKHPQALGGNKAMIYTGRFLTTIFNATLFHKKSILVTWRLQTIFNATFVATTCCTTLNRFQILTCCTVSIFRATMLRWKSFRVTSPLDNDTARLSRFLNYYGWKIPLALRTLIIVVFVGRFNLIDI